MDVVQQAGADQALRLRFGLSGGASANQYAALRVATPQGIVGNTRLSFAARAEQPLRISVQLQSATGRWQRSVYVDTSNQQHAIFLDDFTPVGETDLYRVPLADVRNVLFVIDTVNSKPGLQAGCGLQRRRFRTDHVRTVKRPYSAAAPNRMFADQAASIGVSTPPSPSALNTFRITQ
jgi:hypothetical protein